jgi:hypothetical protein
MRERAGLEQPYPAEWTVRQALHAYLDENGFSTSAYDEPWTQATFFGLRFAVPNPPGHRRAIMLHDLHHVATGFGTNPAGEGEISGWEVGGGLTGLDLYVRTIVLGGLLLGLTTAPRRTVRAFRAARRGGNLFTRSLEQYEELLDRPVSELRAQLGLPEHGLADRPRQLHWDAPVAERETSELAA